MKSILFVLLFIALSFAQYSSDIINADGTFTTSTGWSLGGTATVSGGTGNLTGDGTTANLFQDLALTETNTDGDTVRVEYDVAANTLNTSTSAIYGTYFWVSPSNRNFYAEWLTVGAHAIELEASATNNRINFRTQAAAASGTISFDNIVIRQRLSILYIAKTGNDTNRGESGTPILTLGEAESRGFYSSGGAFNIAAGTYDETFTIGEGTTITGNNCTVTTIACGTKAVTLEGTDFTITNLTGTNITDNRVTSSTDNLYIKYSSEYTKY